MRDPARSFGCGFNPCNSISTPMLVKHGFQVHKVCFNGATRSEQMDLRR